MRQTKLYPVVMAGGSGSRLWPLSRVLYPKQFLCLKGDLTMLQTTICRLNGVECESPVVICNEQHRFIVAEQLRQLNKLTENIILEPAGRTQMIAIIRRIVAQGNHVIISSHDIDLIYEISDAVYVLRQGQILMHGAPGEVFACTEAMEHAGLTQPWLVKLHTQLGLPLCKTETEFFHRMQKCAFREAS